MLLHGLFFVLCLKSCKPPSRSSLIADPHLRYKLIRSKLIAFENHTPGKDCFEFEIVFDFYLKLSKIFIVHHVSSSGFARKHFKEFKVKVERRCFFFTLNFCSIDIFMSVDIRIFLRTTWIVLCWLFLFFLFLFALLVLLGYLRRDKSPSYCVANGCIENYAKSKITDISFDVILVELDHPCKANS